MALCFLVQTIHSDRFPVDLHRVGLCHDDVGCGCGCYRTRRHHCDCCRAHHDRCCDLRDRCCCDGCCYDDCDCDRHDRCYCDCCFGFDRSHDVHLEQLECPRARPIQFPNRQVAHRRRRVQDQKVLLQALPAYPPLVRQLF